MVKGFLEINPNVCFGCGSDFQSKDENKPGYLTSLKMKRHLLEMKEIKENLNGRCDMQLASNLVKSKLSG